MSQITDHQSLQRRKVSPSKTEISPVLTYYFFEKGPNKSKQISDFQNIFRLPGGKLPAAQGDPLQSRKNSPELTHFCRRGPFSKHLGSPRSHTGIDIFRSRGEWSPTVPTVSPALLRTQVSSHQKRLRFRQE